MFHPQDDAHDLLAMLANQMEQTNESDDATPFVRCGRPNMNQFLAKINTSFLRRPSIESMLLWPKLAEWSESRWRTESTIERVEAKCSRYSARWSSRWAKRERKTNASNRRPVANELGWNWSNISSSFDRDISNCCSNPVSLYCWSWVSVEEIDRSPVTILSGRHERCRWKLKRTM